MAASESLTSTLPDIEESKDDVNTQPISNAGYMVVASMLSVVWVLGTLFNATSLCVFAANKKLQSPTNMFVMALNLCDLCMSFVGTFLTMTSAWKKEWLYGHPGCVFEGFTVYFLGLTSMYLLSAISFDRYIVIAKPLLGPRITHKVAGRSIAACWLGGLLWSACPLLGWNEYVREGAGISCSVVWESSDPVYSSYVFTIFACVFLLPLALMVFSYYHVYMTIRTISRNPNWNKNSRVTSRNLRVEKKMAKTIAFMLGAYLACWMPYAVLSFMVVFQGSRAVSPTLATYPAALAKCQGLFNPVLYVATNRQFRQAFYDVIPISSLRTALQRREDCSPDSDSDDDDDNDDNDNSQTTSRGQGVSRSVTECQRASVPSKKMVSKSCRTSRNVVHVMANQADPSRAVEVYTVTELLEAEPPNASRGQEQLLTVFTRPSELASQPSGSAGQDFQELAVQGRPVEMAHFVSDSADAGPLSAVSC